MTATTQDSTETPVRFSVGDDVKILTSPGLTGRVIEIRGAFSPNGSMVYRLRLRCKSRKPVHIEVREDQLDHAAPSLATA